MMKYIYIISLLLCSCSFIKIGSVTDLYKKESTIINSVEFKSINELHIETLDYFKFYYIVNFDCKKNTIPLMEQNNYTFYLVENSIINIKAFTNTIISQTNSKLYYYLPYKRFNNPNKNFEYFVELLKKDYNITQKGYLIQAKRKAPNKR